MVSCDRCSDLLLDHLYGLLDGAEAQGLRDHLSACPACRSALTEAEVQQRLISRASHIYVEVPAFTAPAAEPVAPTPEPAAVPAPATLPLPPRRRLRWGWLSAAAGLLLAALGLYGVYAYQQGLASRQDSLRLARGEVKRLDERFAEAQVGFRHQLAALPVALRDESLYLRVTGPAGYSPSSGGRYHILTRDPEGNAARAAVTVRLVDPVPAPGRTLLETQLESKGEQTVTLPPGLGVRPGSMPRLEVEARTGKAPARVEEMLAVPAPAYVTHLATSKPTYRTGEMLYFRSLTLDRFSLKPPAPEVRLTFTLLGPDNQPVFRETGVTQNGIAGGQFPLALDLDEGQYTLQVAAASADGKGPQVLPERHRLRVTRVESPRLRFDRPHYAPGEKGVATFHGRRLLNGLPVPNQEVVVEADLDGKPLPLAGGAPGKPLQLRTDQEGKALIPFAIPPDAPAKGSASLRIRVRINDGLREQKVSEQVTVAPRRDGAGAVAVEFFPEGGELVAGLPARVYFQARDADGRPVALEGRVLDRGGAEVARARTAEGVPGRGVFSFTPAAGQSYRLEARPAKGSAAVAALPAVRPEGVALTAPESVAAEGAPLRVTVYDSVPGRSLLVVATCRGRLVDQREVRGSRSGTAVELHPVSGTRGVVRVTICEVRTGTLVPLAERLVYRAPAQFLALSVAGGDGKAPRRFAPGASIDLTARAAREDGQPADAWLLAAVVAEGTRAGAQRQAEESPAARFYLTREIRHPQDLEDADILLADKAGARQALDLFLGTGGWRRIVRPEPAGEAVVLLEPKEARTRAMAGLPAVLIADNGEQAVKERYLAALAARRRALGEQAERSLAALSAERERRAEDARLAAADLERYEARPREYLAQAVTVLLLGLFAAGGLFLAIGLVRVARGAGSGAPSFAAACGALALCVVTYLLTSDLRTPADTDGSGARVADLAAKPGQFDPGRPDRADERRAQAHPSRHGNLHVLGGGTQTADALPGAAKGSANSAQQPVSPTVGDLPPRGIGKGLERPMVMVRPKVGPGVMPMAKPFRAGPKPVGPPPRVPGGMAKKGGNGADEPQILVLQEYAHRRWGGSPSLQDTVYWHPALYAAGGTAHLRFDLPDGVQTYRVVLYGHDGAGRLGTYVGKIQAK